MCPRALPISSFAIFRNASSTSGGIISLRGLGDPDPDPPIGPPAVNPGLLSSAGPSPSVFGISSGPSSGASDSVRPGSCSFSRPPPGRRKGRPPPDRGFPAPSRRLFYRVCGAQSDNGPEAAPGWKKEWIVSLTWIFYRLS